MSKQNKYSITSNEVKLFKHMDRLQQIQEGKAAPVMFHIAPTNKCNMSCDHCCFKDRDKSLEIHHLDLIKALEDMKKLGVKSIEWTGGGEPTLYKALPEVTRIAYKMGFKIGMNTNALHFREDLDYNLFEWVRVSLNAFDLDIDLRKFKSNVNRIQGHTKVTACYIYSEKGNYLENTGRLVSICEFAKKNKIYTRLAPDCIQDKKDIEHTIQHMKDDLDDINEYHNPYIVISDFNVFLGERENDVCMMHMLKPFLYGDGWVYTCPSSELAMENAGVLRKKFRVCKVEDIYKYYTTEFDIRKHDCSYCKYTNQNNILKDIITEVDDEKFC